MHGVRTYPSRGFAELFAPLFRRLRGLSWLAIGEQSFAIPASWVDASDYDPAGEKPLSGPHRQFLDTVHRVTDGPRRHGYYAAADLFPQFADGVSSDWSTLVGVAQPVVDPLQWLEDYWQAKDRPEYLRDRAEVIFLSVDSAFWEFFAKDETLVTALATHFAERGITFEKTTFEGRFDYL